ncbi:MAG: hypothetical protein M1308_15680 [Actinobacteria bacterium]|nr:hypothetical protein [Actinomycetota bacterium]
MEKNFFRDSRFWTGIVFIVTAVGYIVTGEKTLNQLLPEIIITVIGIIQIVLGITVNDPIKVGSKVIGGKK